MARKSVLAQIEAERKFPIRVRVFVPPGGLGRRFDHLHEWLRERHGNSGYFVGSCTREDAYRDGILIYLPDADPVQEIIARFDGLVGVAELPSIPTPAPQPRPIGGEPEV